MSVPDDEFKVVTRRRKSNRLLGRVHRLKAARENGTKERDEEDSEIDAERLQREVLAAVEFLEDSDYGNILFRRLDEALGTIDAPDLPAIICYGLGNYSQTRASKFQLAAVLAIKRRYGSNATYVYDPLFLSTEIEILRNLGLEIIERNEEAKRSVGSATSLVYMPHCPYQLTNNFIYANWTPERLVNCVVLSNSFGELVQSIYSKNLPASTNYIERIYPYTKETQLENTFRHEEVFNGNSIHVFPRAEISRLSSDHWRDRLEPIYREAHCEFVRSNVEDEEPAKG